MPIEVRPHARQHLDTVSLRLGAAESKRRRREIGNRSTAVILVQRHEAGREPERSVNELIASLELR
jgi:hypothetical protein